LNGEYPGNGAQVSSVAGIISIVLQRSLEKTGLADGERQVRVIPQHIEMTHIYR
jgi:hypothetical protein